MTSAAEFLKARDYLLAHRCDYELVCRNFSWPVLDRFNWALDYFDVMAAGNSDLALWIVDENGKDLRRSFAELSNRSNQVGNFPRALGARRGDCILVMLGNQAPLAPRSGRSCRGPKPRPAAIGGPQGLSRATGGL